MNGFRLGWVGLMALIAAGAPRAGLADELRAPAFVVTQADGWFSFDAKFYKGTGTDELAGFGWTGEENVAGGMAADCFCIPGTCTLEAGDSLTIQVTGRLTDPALQGRVGIQVSLCVSPGQTASTTILPHGTTDAAGPTTVRAPRFWNGPNPISSSTTFYWDQTETGWVQLAIFDVAGRRLTTLVDEPQPAGQQRVTWHLGSTPALLGDGVYFVRLSIPGRSYARPIVVMRR